MMTPREAARVVGNQPRQCIANMRRALELMTWRNYPEDWRRLEACYVILRTPKAKRLETRAPDGSFRSK